MEIFSSPGVVGTGTTTVSELDGEYTVDSLPVANIAYMRKTAWVTDLFGAKADRVMCFKSGDVYFWQPLRPVFRGDVVLLNNLTLGSLKHPSVLSISGTIGTGITRDITLSPGHFPGQSQRIKRTASGLGTLRVVPYILTSGVLNIGTPLSIIMGATAEYFWDFDRGWEQWT